MLDEGSEKGGLKEGLDVADAHAARDTLTRLGVTSLALRSYPRSARSRRRVLAVRP
jgi:hypothetical protein